jgi:hypothetical protein
MKKSGLSDVPARTDWVPRPKLKRAMREVEAGIGLVRVGSTKEEIHSWTQRLYARARKKQKG